MYKRIIAFREYANNMHKPISVKCFIKQKNVAFTETEPDSYNKFNKTQTGERKK